jgi:hypothetical protein
MSTTYCGTYGTVHYANVCQYPTESAKDLVEHSQSLSVYKPGSAASDTLCLPTTWVVDRGLFTRAFQTQTGIDRSAVCIACFGPPLIRLGKN